MESGVEYCGEGSWGTVESGVGEPWRVGLSTVLDFHNYFTDVGPSEERLQRQWPLQELEIGWVGVPGTGGLE